MAVSDLNILPVYKGGLIKINTGDYSCLYSCAVVIQPLIETAVEHIKEFKINSGYQYTGIMIYTISGSPLLIVLDCLWHNRYVCFGWWWKFYSSFSRIKTLTKLDMYMSVKLNSELFFDIFILATIFFFKLYIKLGVQDYKYLHSRWKRGMCHNDI